MADSIAETLDAERTRHTMSLDQQKIDLERARFRTETVKWIAIAVGAVMSFVVIDYGKLELEKFRSLAENERELLKSYLAATDSSDPEVWKRKLNVIMTMSDDQSLRQWATEEIAYIRNFAARDALYRETLKVSSQLVERSQLADPARKALRARFNQLYWADLPFVGESRDVELAMVEFRRALIAAEATEANSTSWEDADGALLALSRKLRDSTGASGTERP